MARQVPHEITLLAFVRNDDGTRSVLDIVETSFHFASHFTRRWVRDPMVAAIGTATPEPGAPLSDRITMRSLAA